MSRSLSMLAQRHHQVVKSTSLRFAERVAMRMAMVRRTIEAVTQPGCKAIHRKSRHGGSMEMERIAFPRRFRLGYSLARVERVCDYTRRVDRLYPQEHAGCRRDGDRSNGDDGPSQGCDCLRIVPREKFVGPASAGLSSVGCPYDGWSHSCVGTDSKNRRRRRLADGKWLIALREELTWPNRSKKKSKKK